MQTFMVSTDLRECASVLDHYDITVIDKNGREKTFTRLGNQFYREGLTLIRGGWPNHPAAKMWKGYEYALGMYLLALAERLADEGHNTPAFHDQIVEINDIMDACDNEDFPPWWGDDEIYATHRGTLLYKAPEHYEQFGWAEAPLPPNPETGKFQYKWPV